jgi:MFS family permease
MVILVCGTLALLISFGVRQVTGLFIAPVSADLGWERDVFSLAIAVQALMWGVFTPLAGAIADKFGSARAVAGGGVIYAAGMFLLARMETPFDAVFSLGVLTGIGMGAASFSIILAVVGRAAPPDRRGLYLGIVSAGGSSGQFVLVPAAQYAIDGLGWVTTLLALSALVAVIVPLSLAFAGSSRVRDGAAHHFQSIGAALAEAARHRGYVLLTTGYFVCGFQLSFISAHLPGYLADAGAPTALAAWALSLVGLLNVAGCFFWGRLGDGYSKKNLLAMIYAARGAAIAVFVMLPVNEANVMGFAAVIGFLWLGTIPLTSGMVAHLFGVRYMATLTGVVFVSHQLGSFAGVWLGGAIYAATGGYDVIWWVSAALGFAAALINYAIDERPAVRATA